MRWKYPWYYFADLIALVEERARPEDYLLEKLIDMATSQQNKLADILQGEKSAHGDPELFSTMIDLPALQDRPCYKWEDKRFNIDLAIHRFPASLGGQSFLAPDKIYLPWPFRHPRGEELQNAVLAAGLPEPGPLPEDAYKPDEHLLIDEHLEVIDELLFEAGEQFWNELKNKPIVKRNSILEAKALSLLEKEISLPKPDFFQIRLSSPLLSNKTYLECGNTGPITMHIGLNLNRQEGRYRYDDWPNGPFDRQAPCY